MLPGWVKAILLGGVGSLLMWFILIIFGRSGIYLEGLSSKFAQYLIIFLFNVPSIIYYFIYGILPEPLSQENTLNYDVFMPVIYFSFWAGIFGATYVLNRRYLEFKERSKVRQ
jgi:hypothetical protein